MLCTRRKPQPSEVDKAVLSLKTQRRKLGEYQRQLQEKVSRAKENAQRCLQQKNKQRALFNLKQKKLFDVRLVEIDQYLVNIEESVSHSPAQEPAQVTATTTPKPLHPSASSDSSSSAHC